MVASKFFAVGALCPHARSGVGALATQALVNPLYAAPALDGLALGQSPASIIKRLTSADEGRDHRQLHLIGASGQAAGYTGSACIDWCGHRAGVGYSVAGNMLAGPQVIEATALAYEAHAQLPFAERLITALAAGEAAGGDKRGKQAAALLDLHHRRLLRTGHTRGRPCRSRCRNCAASTTKAWSATSPSAPACPRAAARRASPTAR